MSAVAPVEKIKPALTDGHRDRQESTDCGRPIGHRDYFLGNGEVDNSILSGSTSFPFIYNGLVISKNSE